MKRTPIPQDLYSIALEVFDGDRDKADLWFRLENPMLGWRTPMAMINLGRSQFLKSAMQSALKVKRNGEPGHRT